MHGELSDFQAKFSERPLHMGAVRAFRRFNASPSVVFNTVINEQLRLMGLMSNIWHDGENDAECLSFSARYTITPTGPSLELDRCKGQDLTQCTCGFYAYWELQKVLGDPGSVFGMPHFITVTEHWGETLIGEYGLRSRKARIVAACITPNILMRMTLEARKKLYSLYPSVKFYSYGELPAMLKEFPVKRPFDDSEQAE